LISVLDLARDRVEQAFLLFDEVIVSFSGGKDSTVVLELAIEAAKKLNRLPVKVYFIDEEIIPTETESYVAAVSQRKEVELYWVCFPVVHRNASSYSVPHWFPWHPKDKDKWTREIPENALSIYNHLGNIPYPLLYPSLFPFLLTDSKKRYCILRGLRTQESLRRRQLIVQNRKRNLGLDEWINYMPEFVFYKYSEYGFFQTFKKTYNHIVQANPIYDFTLEDVWLFHKLYCSDYNKIYDLQQLSGINNTNQRVCQPLGEEPLANIKFWQQTSGETYDKLVERVEGVNTASRYIKTELYSSSKTPKLDYKTEIFNLLMVYHPAYRLKLIKHLKEHYNYHKSKTDRPLGNRQDVLTNCGYKVFYNSVKRGDTKNRYLSSIRMRVDSDRLNKLGVTLNQLKEITVTDLSNPLHHAIIRQVLEE
jgi:predicted phosphoadenosine phosphosulfate sulfurtransferase